MQSYVTNLTNIDLITMEDIYVHPQLGASRHPWGIWTPKSGLQVFYDRDRMLRRFNLKKYPLKGDIGANSAMEQ
ncbi:unnamed protein product [Leptidea sinapis]|uniref:Uncharacterized protein n=1 Tax=Leptidea sinapis TaxID=189913 RepID=A0A5E4PWR1_9NEOP|nr:unnamed protein product [Leptidea sinapis]